VGILIDMHLHTKRHSRCSAIDPKKLVRQAVKRGLAGVVITEHHYQWPEDELQELRDACDEPGFILLAGFEYTSSQGDILIYGLEPRDVPEFSPGMPPERALDMARALGGFCVAAHPTRAGLGFDERIFTLPLNAIEVRSVNLQEHEQRLAIGLAGHTGLPPMASSDAHRIDDVGRYANEFDDPILTMAHLRAALKRGRFRPKTILA
jgi:predicted metal-dependent phosphoesterase TrpH